MFDISHHKVDGNGIPILSASELENIGDALIKDFCPEVISKPQEVDIEAFSELYMGFKQDFQYLSHCGFIMGMMVYDDTDFIPVYNPQKNEAEYVHADKGTVIIDSMLLEKNQEHRYRFTLAHEAAGHGVLHSSLLKSKENNSVSGSNEHNWLQCTNKTVQAGKAVAGEKSSIDWMEWQANSLASAVLMPRLSIRNVLKNCDIYEMNDPDYACCIILHVAQLFNVSEQAALIRLQKLGYITSEQGNSVSAMYQIF